MSARDVLEGKPLKMPLHVAIVHFPIAFFTLSVLLDVAAHLTRGGSNALTRGAFYTLTAGIVGALVAAIPGLIDYSSIRSDHPGRSTATWHMLLNIAAVVLYATSLAMRWGHLDLSRTPAIPFALSIIGIATIGVSGYLGGVLVYDDGIGVGRHRRRIPPPKRTLRINDKEDSSGFVPVVSESELSEGQTLRLDVAGTVMTLVRLQGQAYAFQEFCTHRCGPLSEGCFVDGQVQCPWHNSRFDVRTGKVTKGPAKLDLKVFEIQIRDGLIWVRRPAAPSVDHGQEAASEQKQSRPEIAESEAKRNPDQSPDSRPAPARRETL
jgi:nitrite reductase/ring-hydroxylating ferredoxin subunit/uncharacterized membrane protein